MDICYSTPDPSLLLRSDGILVRRSPEREVREPDGDDLLTALRAGFGRGIGYLSAVPTISSDHPWLPSQSQRELFEKTKKVFETFPVMHEFAEFAFAIADWVGLTADHDPLLRQVQAIDHLLHEYFKRVDQQIFASWSATRLAMLADVQATASAARETIRSIFENRDDLTAPLTTARLAHADRDSLVAVNAFTSGLDSGYWLRPFSESAVGLDDWGHKFDDRAPVFGDGTVWDPRMALPTLMYALVVRTMVLKAMYGDSRRYCHEINQRVQFLLEVQMRWQSGIRHKYQLSSKEMLFGAGFTVRPFAAGAIDVYTGNHHVIDVDADALNLYYALGYWGGPLPSYIPWLHPENVAPDISQDDIDMRYESEYQPILAKQTNLSFTRLRWLTGLHAFSDTVKSLGEICAGRTTRRIVQVYRDSMKLSRDRATSMPGTDRQAQWRAELARSLTHLLYPSKDQGSARAMADRFELYCALQEDRGTLMSELTDLLYKHLGEGAQAPSPQQ
jgi:hypothetical protein